MNNLLVFPLTIPLLTAVALIFGHNRIMLQRWISLVGSLIHLVVSCLIVRQVHHDGIQTLYMGGWLPPYGIIFVADMFAALLVLSTSVVSLACLLYAFRTIGQDRERYYFYPFFQFLIVGVCGSFLTGDLFNLFVCFEVMLISSYALIVLGGTKRQLRETLKYILINIVSSALFVAAVAYLYSVTGTLNMAHLSVRIAELEQAGILTVIAVMLLTVFALKAGLLLFFWLPGSYSAPPAAVRAVFAALLTKVGLYAIVRTVTLLFPYQPDLIRDGIGMMAMATMVLGGIGAVAYTNIHKIINYNVILGIGFIGFGIAVGNHASMDGVIFYLLHDMLAKALLFLLGGMLIKAAGTEDLREMGGLIKRYPLLGWLFFIVTLALVGVPPLSGFPGKMLMLRGGLESGNILLTAVAVLSSLLVLYSLIRVFIGAFLGEEKRSEIGEESFKGLLAITFGLLVLLVGMGLGAEEIYAFVSQAGRILVTPELYVEAVLKR